MDAEELAIGHGIDAVVVQRNLLYTVVGEMRGPVLGLVIGLQASAY